MAPRSPSSSGSVRAMAAAASRSTLNVPTRLTMTVFVKPSRLWADPSRATTRSAQPMPAQLTAMRSGRSLPVASAIAACTEASSVTSVRTKVGCPPSSLASSWPRSSRRSRMVTAAPRATRARVVASPSPEAPPVTTAATSKFFMPGNVTRWNGLPAGPRGEPASGGGQQKDPVPLTPRKLGASLRTGPSAVAGPVPGLDLAQELLDPLGVVHRAHHGHVGGVHDDAVAHTDQRHEVFGLVAEDDVAGAV